MHVAVGRPNGRDSATSAWRISEPSRPPVMLTIDRLDFDLRHALCRVDGEADRLLGGLEVDDRAAFQPARALVADADDAGAMRAAPQRVRFGDRVQAGHEATTLLVPTSSTDSTALLRGDSGFRRGVRLGLRWLTWDSPWLVLAVP